jgi:multiple sugar transport system ATP-binding protein
MAQVTLQDVSKSYNGVEAVKSLSLDIDDGKLLALLGPPGAGKSSTVKMIAGVEDVTEGEVLFDDEAVTALPPNQRDVAMVFESYALYPHMTAFDNIAYPLREHKRKLGLDETQIADEVNRIADLLQFREHLGRKPGHLSGGQKQRVALGRALVRHPRVLLLDEPIAHLDARLRHHLRGELKRIQRERNVTTVYATPDYLEAIAVADEVAVMFDGELHQVAPPAEILERPATARIAELVGDPPMNILPASLIREDGQLRINCEVIQAVLPVPDRLKGRLEQGAFDAGVLIGFRPGDIGVGPVTPDEELVAELYVVERLHRKAILSLEICDTLFKVNAPTTFAGQLGDRVSLDLPPERMAMFDAKTLRAIT